MSAESRNSGAMNAPAVERYVEQLVSLAEPPDERRCDQRSDGRDQEEGEICFQSDYLRVMA